MPNITGWTRIVQATLYTSGGGAIDTGTRNPADGIITTGGSYQQKEFTFDASRVSSVYDSGITVRPAAVYTNWCVKY